MGRRLGRKMVDVVHDYSGRKDCLNGGARFYFVGLIAFVQKLPE